MAGAADNPQRRYRVFVELELLASDPDQARDKADRVFDDSPDDKGWRWEWEVPGAAEVHPRWGRARRR